MVTVMFMMPVAHRFVHVFHLLVALRHLVGLAARGLRIRLGPVGLLRGSVGGGLRVLRGAHGVSRG